MSNLFRLNPGSAQYASSLTTIRTFTASNLTQSGIQIPQSLRTNLWRWWYNITPAILLLDTNTGIFLFIFSSLLFSPILFLMLPPHSSYAALPAWLPFFKIYSLNLPDQSWLWLIHLCSIPTHRNRTSTVVSFWWISWIVLIKIAEELIKFTSSLPVPCLHFKKQKDKLCPCISLFSSIQVPLKYYFYEHWI